MIWIYWGSCACWLVMWCKMILADFVAECNLSHEDSFNMRIADLHHHQVSRISHSVYHNFLTFDFFFFFFLRPRSSGAASALSVAPASSSPYKPLTFTLVPLVISSDNKEPSKSIVCSQTDKDCQVKINAKLWTKYWQHESGECCQWHPGIIYADKVHWTHPSNCKFCNDWRK